MALTKTRLLKHDFPVHGSERVLLQRYDVKAVQGLRHCSDDQQEHSDGNRRVQSLDKIKGIRKKRALSIFNVSQKIREGCGCFRERIQKNPRVRKIRVRNSGAGNGCANFMDAWKKCVLSAGKTMSVKFLLFRGGFGGGGGKCRFYFYGRADFSDCSGVLQENSGKVPGKLLEKFSRIAKCYKF